MTATAATVLQTNKFTKFQFVQGYNAATQALRRAPQQYLCLVSKACYNPPEGGEGEHDLWMDGGVSQRCCRQWPEYIF